MHFVAKRAKSLLGDYLAMEGLPDAGLCPKLMQAFKTSNHIAFERQTHLKQNVKETNQAIFSVKKQKHCCIIF